MIITESVGVLALCTVLGDSEDPKTLAGHLETLLIKVPHLREPVTEKHQLVKDCRCACTDLAYKSSNLPGFVVSDNVLENLEQVIRGLLGI